MPQSLIRHIRVYGLCVLFLILVVLPTRSDARGSKAVEITADGGCKVWIDLPRRDDKATWSGKCDAQGYATGEGTLFVNADRGDRRIATLFVGEMRGGEMAEGAKFENSGYPTGYGNYFWHPPVRSGQMNQIEMDSWHNSMKGRLGRLMNTDAYTSNWAIKVTGKLGTMYYFGTDAERIANQTGVAAFAAYISSFRPSAAELRYFTSSIADLKSSSQKKLPAKREVQQLSADACTKIKIVNGKKLCEE